MMRAMPSAGSVGPRGGVHAQEADVYLADAHHSRNAGQAVAKAKPAPATL